MELVGLTVQGCIWICAVAMRERINERLSVRGSSVDRACRMLAGVQPLRRMDPCGALSPDVRGSGVECHRWGARERGS